MSPVTANAGRISNAPTSGRLAPSQMTGSASWSSPAWANARSVSLGSGRANGTNPAPTPPPPAAPPVSPPAPPPGPPAPLVGSMVGSMVGAGWARAATARRTVSVDTPANEATSRSERPSARHAQIRSASSGTSFDGPFGPRCSKPSPPTPPASHARIHFRNVSSLTPNASATSKWRAAFVATNVTAARRRPTTSPEAQHDAAIPHTNVTPPPSSSTRATAGPTLTDPAGTSGSGRPERTLPIPAPTATPATPTTILSHETGPEWWISLTPQGILPPMLGVLESRRVAGGIAPPGSRRTRREGLPSPGSHRPTLGGCDQVPVGEETGLVLSDSMEPVPGP